MLEKFVASHIRSHLSSNSLSFSQYAHRIFHSTFLLFDARFKIYWNTMLSSESELKRVIAYCLHAHDIVKSSLIKEVFINNNDESLLTIHVTDKSELEDVVCSCTTGY